MKKLKLVLISLGGLVLLLAAIAVSITLLFDPNDYKPQLQAAASEALSMQVQVKGRLGIRFYPGLRLVVQDVEVRDQDKQLVAIKEVRVGLELMPLLQQQYRIKSVSLISPAITLESDAVASKSKRQDAKAEMPAIELSKISISDGKFSYVDKATGDKFAAKGCDITLRNLRLQADAVDLEKNLSFTSDLLCRRVNIQEYAVSNVKLSVLAKGGVYELKPIAVSMFSGSGIGEIRADYSGSTPRYKVRFSLPHFSIAELLKAQSSAVILAGAISFAMDVSLQGSSARQLEQSAAGDVLLQGKNLKLRGYDLDTVFSRFESSQSFNLLDMGALLVAGPAGVAITKGRDFAGILTSAKGETDISTIVARWKVKRGVMRSSDVAMATAKHRVALLGALDIAGKRFVDVVVALINSKGCAQVQQKISGPFRNPVVEQPSSVKAVAAPVLDVFKKGKELLVGDDNCKVIYAGKVAAPAVEAK